VTRQGRIAAAAAALALVACAGSPVRVALASKEELKSLSLLQLAGAYQTDDVRAEIERRDAERVGSPRYVLLATNEQLASLDEGDLINVWRTKRVSRWRDDTARFQAEDAESRRKAKDELVRRKYFSDEEMRLIEANEVTIGMREAAMITSWWNDASHTNSTRTARGVRKQYVFGLGTRKKYVYTDHGLVTTIQD